MAETSFPIQESPLSVDQWKSIMLAQGRGIIDRGGWPYRLTNRDSVTDTVTIGIPTTEPRYNEAVLDGFVHRIDAPKDIYLAPVSSDTTYEIGLLYDPANQDSAGGPITLTSWIAPGDTTEGKSRLVLYRVYRKANLALGSTTYAEERPRVCPVISVSRESQLPVSGLVLVDTLALVRTTLTLHKADINESGVITWTTIGGGGSSSTGGFSNSNSEIDSAVDKVQASTWDSTGSTLMWRGWDGVARVKANVDHADNILNRSAGDGRYARTSHTHNGSDITSRVPFEHVDGSDAAWSNTSLGSTWATVAVNSSGFLGRYPSALKYKDNVRRWGLDPSAVYAVSPVQYEDKNDGDTRVGFVADAYTTTLPEMVQVDPITGEVEGFNYFLFCVAQQVAIRDLHKRNQTLEHNLTEVLALLGLNTDDTGRVITTDGDN